MKIIILTICFLIGYVLADVKELKLKQQQIPIVDLQSNIEHDGTYHYHYEGGDGTRANQDGQLKAIADSAGEAVQGEFSYVGDDGQTYSVQYTADENGYVPHGAHIPTPPPIPEAIQKALDHLATAPPPKE